MMDFDLYKELILDHNRNPRNFGVVGDSTHSCRGFNPFCGDKVDITIKLDDGCIKEIAFEGEGCAISRASASMMCEAIKGKRKDEAKKLFEKFGNMMKGTNSSDEIERLGKLSVFQTVTRYPSRIKCAVLPWHTFVSALDNIKVAKTE